MNRAEVEALLFRMQVAYPLVMRPDDLEARARVEEWLATTKIAELDPVLAVDAFTDWKETEDKPPTIRQFLERCQTIRNRKAIATSMAEQRGLLAEYDETVVPPDEAREHIAKVRETAETMRRRSQEMLE